MKSDKVIRDTAGTSASAAVALDRNKIKKAKEMFGSVLPDANKFLIDAHVVCAIDHVDKNEKNNFSFQRN